MNILLELSGTTPLVMHNARLADPLDPFAKEIAAINAKRIKTESDLTDRDHWEFLGGLYHDPDVGLHIPARAVVATFVEAGKVTRQGTAVLRGFSVVTDRLPLAYDGPKKPEDLWAEPTHRWRTGVGVKQNTVMRMRPIFRRWSLAVEGELMEDMLNPDDFRGICEKAGRSIGLLDARTLGYGRFTVAMA